MAGALAGDFRTNARARTRFAGGRVTNTNPATAAARDLLYGLANLGVRDVVLCPGSRSAPLAFAAVALERAGKLRVHVRHDERVGAFTALGAAKFSTVTGDPRPAVVLTTSGTATANLHPAVLEAAHSHLPLIALTADRPHELRGVGANQTTDQVALFGSAARWSVRSEEHTSELQSRGHLVCR